MASPMRASQDALDAFVTTQLIDNGMDAVATKINRLYLKLQRSRGDDAAQRKYAQQLRHYLTLACRLLARQRDDVGDCITVIERDLKRGVLGDGAVKGKSLPPTPSMAASASAASMGAANGFGDLVDDVLAPGRHVAAKVARSHELWILARVVSYDAMTRTYEVEDVDTGDDEDDAREDTATDPNAPVQSAAAVAAATSRRHHVVPRDQVKALPAETLATDAWIHYMLNQRVMAMYPNTTSFYRAIVRVPNPKGAPYVLVRFDDDADEYGSSAPERKIPFRFVVAL